MGVANRAEVSEDSRRGSHYEGKLTARELQSPLQVCTLCLCEGRRALPLTLPGCGTEVKIPIHRGTHASQAHP